MDEKITITKTQLGDLLAAYGIFVAKHKLEKLSNSRCRIAEAVLDVPISPQHDFDLPRINVNTYTAEITLSGCGLPKLNLGLTVEYK